ncbi:MAG: tetratricopeptide repeat protein [Caldilineaceae bacterium]|nr:tetratricopeptide repeat protein [Caldilineaceae bacterium]
MLHIHLFGNLRIFLDNQPLRFPGLPKTLPLWAYLLLQRRSALTREQVAFTLWPDEDEPVARGNLRRHLHDLRRALPPAADDRPWLLADGGKIQWNPEADFWLDVAEFEASCQDVERLADAVALYNGDLLVGIYDDWIFFERERLRNDFFMALNRLVQDSLARQEYWQGIDYVLKLLAHDPLREDAVRDLMLLRSLAGDRTGALREYKQFEGRLATELNVAPMPETSELYRAIVQNETIQRPTSATQDLFTVAATPTTRPEIAHNIPATLASFIGREYELARLCDLLQPSSHVRLLTLTGTVGSGKTRLALELAHRILDKGASHYADGVYFVSLGVITEADGVIPAIADALGVNESGHRSLIDDVKAFLSSRHLLLILDNFEQVNAAATAIGELLTVVPHLRVLVTSRSVLHIYGEYEFPVPPLTLPASPHLRAEEMANCAAVALFVERASAVNPDFQLNAGNAAAVAQICLYLDGLPLALELAAARCKLFTPVALLNRLSSRLDFLNSQIQQTPTRQQTLRNVIEWSHNLLSAREKSFFAQLAVFVGDFTLEAAEFVVDRDLLLDESRPAFDLLDGLTSLIDQNMLRSATPNPFNDDPRFRMLLILREFALEQLTQQGLYTRLARRHAHYYANLAEKASTHLQGPQQILWLEYLEAEVENLRVALAWALTNQEAEIALRLACSLGWFWANRGHLFEGQDWLTRVLALPESHCHPPLRAAALIAAARIAYFRGDYQGQAELAAESVAICTAHRLTNLLAQTLHYLGMGYLYQHDYAQAEPLLKDALGRFRQLDDRHGTAMTLAALSMLYSYYEDYPVAHAYIEESMALYRVLGDTNGVASSLLYMAALAYDEGKYADAQILFERCLPLYQPLGNKHAIAFALVNLASLAMANEENQRARDYAERALVIFEEVGERWQPPRLKRIFAYLALDEDNVEQASILCQESFRLNEELGDQRGMIASLIGFAHIAIVRNDLITAARLLQGVRLHLAAIRRPLLANDLHTFKQARLHLEVHLAPHIRLAIESETEIVPLKKLAAPFLT